MVVTVVGRMRLRRKLQNRKDSSPMAVRAEAPERSTLVRERQLLKAFVPMVV